MVESETGRIKRWEYLDSSVPNTEIPFQTDYVRIVPAISNKYCPPRNFGATDHNHAVISKMFHLSQKENELQTLVGNEGRDRRSYLCNVEDAYDVGTDFPILPYKKKCKIMN